MPRTIRVLANNTVEFSAQGDVDLAPLSAQVDVIILCTGYDYHFPFLSNQTSNLQLQVGDRRVSPIVEQLWHAQVPNLAFVGLPHSIVPFPLMELQAQACLNQWSREAKDLPATEEERMRDALADASAGGPNRSGKMQDTHYLGNAQWSYCRNLAKRYAQHVWSDEYNAYLDANEVCTMLASMCGSLTWCRRLFASNVSIVVESRESNSDSEHYVDQTMYDHISVSRNGNRWKNGQVATASPGPDIYRSIRYHRNEKRGMIKVTYPTDARVFSPG
jgi:hypothetical protein